MFTENEPSWEGEHYHIEAAYNEPEPVQIDRYCDDIFPLPWGAIWTHNSLTPRTPER